MTDTDATIDAHTIRRLRERRLTLRHDLGRVEEELVALGVNPHLEPLIVAILKAAACPLSGDTLWRLTKQLMLHDRPWPDYVRHLDRLHAGSQIVPVGLQHWTVPARLPSTELATPTDAS